MTDGTRKTVEGQSQEQRNEQKRYSKGTPTEGTPCDADRFSCVTNYHSLLRDFCCCVLTILTSRKTTDKNETRK